MAVVFISPKQKQKMFLTGIISGVALFSVIIAILVFLSQPKETYNEFVFNRPKVSIDFSVFDSEQFKNLEPFEKLKVQFYYEASIDNEKKEGLISSSSIEDAKKELEDLGYRVTLIQKTEVGRDNPFENYDKSLPIDLQELLGVD
ncbi:MAG: hypothetical protein PHQ20_04495 [Candidatus Moranbacteria bacterium]|nr:hypothetical protein [Candidatus Moranbacteria bacterium]